MSHPYPKHDHLLHCDLTAAERLEKQQAYLRQSVRLLEQSMNTLKKVPDDLTEEQLMNICEAVDAVYNAAHNIVFLGIVGYEAKEVKKVEWRG